MANKTSFTPDEWTKLLESPMMAGLAITAAEPSGLWGLLKESLSSGWALLEARTSGPNELIKALATDFGTSEGRAAARDGVQARLSGSKPAEIRDKAIAALREAAAIVDAKAPAEADAFKEWLKQIAQKAAEASTEGAFWALGAFRSARPKRRPWRRSRARSGHPQAPPQARPRARRKPGLIWRLRPRPVIGCPTRI